MTSIFDETGREVGATAVEILEAEVVRVKGDKDGYEAVQVGAGQAKKLGKSVAGQGKGKSYKVLKEFPVLRDGIKAGDKLGIEQLEAGERVQVSATSKGKGFQGTIKRYNFSRGPMTHGSRNKRRPGSIGGTGAQRVFAGQKMPGRMGNQTVTQRNLRVAAVHSDDKVVLLDGSVPGPPGSLVTITSLAEAGDPIPEEPKSQPQEQPKAKHDDADEQPAGDAKPAPQEAPKAEAKEDK